MIKKNNNKMIVKVPMFHFAGLILLFKQSISQDEPRLSTLGL